MFYFTSKLKDMSRERRSNMSDAEIILWNKLKNKQLKNAQFYKRK